VAAILAAAGGVASVFQAAVGFPDHVMGAADHRVANHKIRASNSRFMLKTIRP
jgi:hypothetical protein